MNMNKTMQLAAAFLAASMLSGAAQAAGPVYAAYSGSQLGVTERDASLAQISSFNTGQTSAGIAVTQDDRIFVTSGSTISEFALGGALVNQLDFGGGIVYGGVSTRGQQLFATYSGSQQGVTLRTLGLGQTSFFATGLNATDLAVGDTDTLYLTAGNGIYAYDFSGNLTDQMVFPDAGILYTGIDYASNLLFASFGGSQQGVTIRDLALDQLSFFATPFTASGIAVGNNSNLFLTSANSIYEYSFGGALLNTMTFPVTSIAYTAIDVKSVGGVVPEPATWAMLIAGFGMVGSAMRRRRSAQVLA